MSDEMKAPMATDEFEELIREHLPALKRLCGGYELNGNKAEELYQEVLVRIWQSLNSFKGNCSMRTWIFRVAHNVAITHVTRECRVNESPVYSVEELSEHLLHPGEQNILEARETVARLKEVLARLRPTDRELMLLYLEGHRQDDIAEIVGLSTSNVATKISRIKNVCRLALESGEQS